MCSWTLGQEAGIGSPVALSAQVCSSALPTANAIHSCCPTALTSAGKYVGK